MKKVVFGFLGLVVLLAGGLVVAPSFIDWSKYKDQGLAQVKALSGYDVQIGEDFSLAFLPFPAVTATHVAVFNPARGADALARFDELSVSVALAPLLNKQVQVSEITLIKPEIDLRIAQDGKGNWLSPEVEALLAKSGGQEGEAAPSGQNNVAVSFDAISIENGSFRFSDSVKGSVTVLSQINLDLNADSLQGPFDAKGDLVFGDLLVAFDVETGAIDAAASALAVNAKVSQGSHDVSYKGVVAIAAPYEAQGEIAVKTSAVAGAAIEVTGAIDANERAVSLKNAALQVGDKTFNGDASVTLKPMAVKAAFASNEIVDLDALLPKKAAGQGGGDIAALLDILPKTVTLPQALDADIALRGAGVVYNKELIKDISLKAAKQGGAFTVELQAADIPGKGPAVVTGDLKFADVSTSASGAQVFSDPVLNVKLQANSQNTAYLVQALSGNGDIPVVNSTKIGKFYIQAEATPGRIALKDSVVNLDDLKLQLSGALKRGSGKRAQVEANVQANSLDFDSIIAAADSVATKSAAASSQDPLTALNLPFDVDASFATNSLIYNSQRFKNIKASAAITDTQKNIKIQAFGGDISIAGQSLDSLKIGVKHPNLAKAAKDFGVALPDYQSLSNPVDLGFGVKTQNGGKSIALSGITGRIMGSNISGSLGFDGSGAKPNISGDLKFGSLTLKSNSGSQKRKNGSGKKWSSDAIDTAFLHGANVDFNVAADRLVFENWDLKSPSLKLSLKDGALDVQDLKAGLFEGKVDVKAKLSSTAPNAPLSLSTQANITNVNLGSLAYGLTGTRQIQADGTVSFAANVSGAGASQKAIVESLGGSATLDGANVTMKGFDLEAVTNAVANDNRESILAAVQSFRGGSTRFDTVNGAYSINKGVANIDSMAMNGVSASIVSAGSANLPRWTLDTKHTVSFNQTDKLDPFSFDIRGPIDKPLNTFGNIGQDLLRAQANKFIQDQIQDRLGDTDIGQKLQQFGILPGGSSDGTSGGQQPSQTAPAAGDAAPVQPRAKTQEEQAQEAIQGIIKGLF